MTILPIEIGTNSQNSAKVGVLGSSVRRVGGERGNEIFSGKKAKVKNRGKLG